MRSLDSPAKAPLPAVARKESLADDLLNGADEIAEFFGLRKRQVFYLASRKGLPGVFRIGGRIFCSKSAARAGIAAKAGEAR